jgi:hypothetical protein
MPHESEGHPLSMQDSKHMSVPHVTAVEKNLLMLLGFVVPMAFWIEG